MNAISGSLSSGFNPSEMLQKMNERFNAADKDGDLAVSKTEFSDIMNSQGVSQTRIEKIFTRLDANGNGEISQQEQQDIMSKMQQRMSSISGGSTVDGNFTQSGFEPINTLLNSLHNQSDNQQEKDKIRNQIDKLQNNRFDSNVMSDSLSLIDELVPSINTNA